MPPEAGEPDERADRLSAGLAEATGNAAFVLALRERGVRDTAVLRAMEQVPRERFAPPALRPHARRDIALPLACGQTMTAPSIVAQMLGALDLAPGQRVLEVGTGTGYVTALLVRLGAAHVRSLERYEGLARAARAHLGRDLSDVTVETNDGLAPEVVRGGSYDRILVNGSLAALPPHLPAALKSGGRLVVGHWTGRGSRLVTLTRDSAAAYARTEGAALRLGPLTPGRALAP
ncbi:MAG: protein-L-isoaspartate O-methyltransferase [Methylobacteriaceae bacterium]|jgi:protein-L-isoaspartate(D-aspartate) O-methyltransferase|uniref:Protein-L-isoaspartate O-methyltransferase n=1 Tax=Methylorubrum extorquens TaxID=408 RepID=A0AAX3WFA4_METEX|nr:MULTISPECIES: protein-L-isoaspartate O-methyltransferase [Methylobacteriaceae]KQO78654.1 protein-L-isoaspartate O-methyltransferase [Methylobacterium sp. Leaf90]KQO90673.1 protein-L-isoaspartate O-methyltransferase [Methylobacterium sp. Leaf92]KQP95691.1 protein-L-isoaspartate O-methyltransferase [Methylobacterium sp. Leaf119]ABY32601.1 Protein-L-isoaspartate(D-aspartate) O-methyltransferase [Methylorubrum extorquens PA1]KQQ17874.1 protein-L-isoaspartate O-methyltransferase [Methylobacteriu